LRPACRAGRHLERRRTIRRIKVDDKYRPLPEWGQPPNFRRRGFRRRAIPPRRPDGNAEGPGGGSASCFSGFRPVGFPSRRKPPARRPSQEQTRIAVNETHMDGRHAKQGTTPTAASDAEAAPPAEPDAPATTWSNAQPVQDARRAPGAEPAFGRILVQVLLVQLVALGLLWALQAAYHR